MALHKMNKRFVLNLILISAVSGFLAVRSYGSAWVDLSIGEHDATLYYGEGLFGFGEKTGELGIVQTVIYGPEIGYLGLVANAAFALVLWRRVDPDSR